MANQKWINEGGIFYPVNGNILIHPTPGPGIWCVYQSPNPSDPRLGLNKLGEKFEIPKPLYSTGGEAIIERVKRLWESDAFIETGKNLGVILNGTKGTGKTISAKVLCNELDIPTIVVNSSFDGLILDFIQSLEFECIILIDEAEKTFVKEDDEILLKLIDGIYNKSRKLYLLTTNRLSINENLLGRPGRIRYIQEFSNLPAATVQKYLEDNLNDKTRIPEILQEVDLLEISTIDILKALVEEVNIMGSLGENVPLNVPRARYIYDVVGFHGCDENSMKIIEDLIHKNKPSEMGLYEWLNSKELVSGDEVKKASDSIIVNEGEDGEKKSDECVYDQLEHFIPGCDYIYVQKMTSNFGNIWKDCETSLGTVIKEPDANGFFLLRGRYDDDGTLYMLLRKRGNPSLYRGGLAI